MSATKKTFVVGRRHRRKAMLVVVQEAPAPIHGPWTLKALVAAK